MHALVGEFAAARRVRIAAPFALVSGTTAVPIPSTNATEFPYLSGFITSVRLGDRGMIAMIKTDFYNASGLQSGPFDRARFLEVAPHRFFQQYVLAGFQRPNGNR